MHLSPAEYVIRVFGGVRACARALNKSPSTISKWQNRGAVPGQIPASQQRMILIKAQELGLSIKPEHLILGYISTTSEARDGADT